MKEIFYFKIEKTEYPVTVKVNGYADNGNLYVGLISADEDDSAYPFTHLTVNTEIYMPPYTAAIKNYSENEQAVNFLIDNNFGKLIGPSILSGFVLLPVFEFDKEKLRILDPIGCARYERK